MLTRRFILVVSLILAVFSSGCGDNVAKDYYKKAIKLSKSKKPEDWEKAIKKFEEVINLKIEAYQYTQFLHKKMGDHLKKKGFWNQAAEHYKESLALQSNDYLVHYNLGICYANLGRVEEVYLDQAIEEYYKSLKLFPEFELPYYGLGIIYFFKKGCLDEGIKCLKKAISLEPRFINAYVTLGKCYYEIKRFNEAALSYQEAIKRSPPKIKIVASYYSNLGIVYQAMRENKKAVDCFKKALEIDPNQREALENLSALGVRVYDRLKRFR
ncbi:tetratricopeptide repeat protein [bacterium]|nr:tetratricopeptide repeat protein [bacterium]MBU0899947.1 tetratricopeptide repeat protein [bacterium]MBU1153152.1 tetratricopeptide repeat protein [bacterium]MBU1782179.1 tetratricopeptide repeat protein [bacterium]MBU2599200.1 tetratricopeptide repeat protein [bacterium]